ncbi:MAG: serine protease [Lachnospiraceae bacterium]|nr:serine protease [Lachnospiraceae bacterium]
MPQFDQNEEKAFIIEKIKERPVNKKKLAQRTLLTAAMAVMFGLIACLTFLLLEPIISKVLYPQEQPQIVVFPEDQDEMAPEDMLSDSKDEQNEDSLLSDGEELPGELAENIFSMDSYQQMYASMSEYVEELRRCMVSVTGLHSDVDWFNEVQTSKYQTYGVIIANNSVELLVLTKYEPLEEADRISLTFFNEEQRTAQLKSYDKVSGLAIVGVNLEDMKADGSDLMEQISIARLGVSSTKSFVGSPVVALGTSSGLGDSVHYGMITAQHTQQTLADRAYSFWITNITGNDSSDGMLFNLRGQLIGIITNNISGSDYENMITVYGISELKKTIEKLSNQEPIAYLGVHTKNVSKEAHEEMDVPYGAFIKRVEMSSPAMVEGMQIGDIITSIDGDKIDDYSDYSSKLLRLAPNQTVEIIIMRQSQSGYKEIKFNITLTEVP